MKSKITIVGALALMVCATGIVESRGGRGGVAGRGGVSRGGGGGQAVRGGAVSGRTAGLVARDGGGHSRWYGKTVRPGGLGHIENTHAGRIADRVNKGKWRGHSRHHNRNHHGYGYSNWGYRSGGNWGPYLLGAGLIGYPAINYAVSSPYEDCYYDMDGELVCQVDDSWYYAS